VVVALVRVAVQHGPMPVGMLVDEIGPQEQLSIGEDLGRRALCEQAMILG
jgi:hypothetical protein